MGRRNSHWLSSIIAVFLIAIVLFFVIYFIFPELSLKFFGIAFGKEEQISTALQDILVDKLGFSSDKVDEFFASEGGKDVVSALVDGTKKGTELTSEKVEMISDTINSANLEKQEGSI